MINYKQLPWKWILCGAFVLLLLLIIFAKKEPKVRIEYKSVPVPDLSTVKELNKYKDSVTIYRKQIAISKQDKVETEKLMDRANKELTRLVNIVKNAPQVEPADCDSLAGKVIEYQTINAQYQADMNELIGYYEDALRASDSGQIYHTKLSAAISDSLKVVVADYNQLAKDFNKQNKKLRRKKGLNRVLATAVLILGGIVLIK